MSIRSFRLWGSTERLNPHQRVWNEFPGSCCLCAESGHQVNNCSLRDLGWVLRVSKYHGAYILGAALNGVCCGYKSSRTIGITFRRTNHNGDLEAIYRLRSFQRLSSHLNLLFAKVVTSVDMKYVLGGGTSFLRLRDNVHLSVPGSDVQYTYLWSDGPPNLKTYDYGAVFTKRIILNRNLWYLVSKLCNLWSPGPEIVQNRYWNLFDGTKSPRRSVDARESFVEVKTDSTEGGVVWNYQEHHEAQIMVNVGSGPL